MSKGLEALKEIKNNLRLFGFDEDTDNFKLLNTIEKELKALEIIKDKAVNVGLLLKAFALENGLAFYNENIYFANGILSLTQEEYDFLREVLL